VVGHVLLDDTLLGAYIEAESGSLEYGRPRRCDVYDGALNTLLVLFLFMIGVSDKVDSYTNDIAFSYATESVASVICSSLVHPATPNMTLSPGQLESISSSFQGQISCRS
jgi:hypothetical protein